MKSSFCMDVFTGRTARQFLSPTDSSDVASLPLFDPSEPSVPLVLEVELETWASPGFLVLLTSPAAVRELTVDRLSSSPGVVRTSPLSPMKNVENPRRRCSGSSSRSSHDKTDRWDAPSSKSQCTRNKSCGRTLTRSQRDAVLDRPCWRWLRNKCLQVRSSLRWIASSDGDRWSSSTFRHVPTSHLLTKTREDIVHWLMLSVVVAVAVVVETLEATWSKADRSAPYIEAI